MISQQESVIGPTSTEIKAFSEVESLNGFPVGKRIPDFKTYNQDGEEIRIYNQLHEDQILILSFCRGDWSQSCKEKLESLQDHYREITARGAEILAITPQNIATNNALYRELDLDFNILCDPKLDIAHMFNIVWKLPENIQQLYLEEYHLDIPNLNANESWHLPVPAIYLINSAGEVLAKFEDVNYSKKMEISTILETLDLSQ